VSSPAIPWQQLLTAEILQLHALRFYLHSLPCRSLLNSLLHCSGYNFLAWTTQKTSSSIIVFISVATGMCLSSCCPEMGCLTPFIKYLLP
jgi:hypothetical protein